MSERPLVSVVIPVHDGERYLAEAIDSVLAQRACALEVVVVDDGSSDASAAIAARYGPPVCVHSQAAAGAGAARNRGIELTHGAFVAFLDADDLWRPRKLELQLAAFAAEPELDVVFGHYREFVTPEADPAAAARWKPRENPRPGCALGTALMRRESLLRIGPLREDLAVGEFVDWMARARESGMRDAMLSDLFLLRRLHGANLTRARRDRLTDLAYVVKQSLDRRRAAAEGAGT
ncbi:MAG: glycosyltransferase family A protein [Thermoleophilaceae bacterium]